MEYKISIILATYNWDSALVLILERLLLQLIKHPNCELIIADDGSDERTNFMINQFIVQAKDNYDINPNRITHVWHEDIGFRKAKILNEAIRHSVGEYLIFLDGDCIIFDDFIVWHIKLMQHGYFVAGNRILLSAKFTNQLINQKISLTKVLEWAYWQWALAFMTKKANKFLVPLRIISNFWRYLRVTDWKYPKGCNFSLWRKDMIAVNGFDEEFLGWGHEDADLFIRLLHYGIKIKDGKFAIPVLHLWHKHVPRSKERDNWDRIMKRYNDATIIKAKCGIEGCDK